MTYHWIDTRACSTLAVLVETVTSPLLMAHDSPVCLELDIDFDLSVPGDAEGVADLIRILTEQALSEMPEGGDLTITGCRTTAGIELEFADTGADLPGRARRLPMAAAAMGAEVQWQNCPQGGSAATVIFPTRRQHRRAA